MTINRFYVIVDTMNNISKVKQALAIFMAVVALFVVSALQFLPFAIYFVLVALEWMGKNVFVWMIALSSFYFVLNFTLAIYDPFVFIDVFVWGLVFFVYILSNES